MTTGTRARSMTVVALVLVLVGAVYFSAAAPAAATKSSVQSSALTSKKDKVSYALGLSLGNSARKQSIAVDPALIASGLGDGLSGGKTLLSEAEARTTLAELHNELEGKKLASQRESQTSLVEKNKTEGEAFLAENKKKDGVVTLPSGLQYKVLRAGDGKKPTDEDTVECRYRGTRIDGTEFDSSQMRGRSATFPVSGAIPGWREALKLMPVGSKWQLVLPPSLSYGARALRTMRGVGSNATLVFELELLAIQNPTASAAARPTQGTERR